MAAKSLIFFAVCLILLFAIFTIGSPFLLAFLAAILLEPVNSLIMKYARMNRLAASTVTCTIFFLGLLGGFVFLGVKVFAQLRDFWGNIPGFINELNVYINNAITRTELFYQTLDPGTAEQLQTGLSNLASSFVEAAKTGISSVSGIFLGVIKMVPNMFIFFLVFIVALYLFSYHLPRLKSTFLALFEKASRHKMEHVLKSLHRSVLGFIKAQMILSFITYTITLAGLVIMQMEYPLAISLLVVIVDVLPILGVGSVLVPWAVYNFMTDDPYMGVGLLILFIVITIIRRIVEPKVLGHSVGIGSISALVSLYIGFQLIGVIGLFLGPLVVIVFQAMRKADLLKIQIKLE
ncbi:sporulation integral membrane protein YtvI [Paenibacillus sp. sptzw28]|uniref:sporulation integral membrane protein YtvI n=1 Tax=Paenibacillus sp. sptzw28 TaxID=715179 RepID=UPI001C6DDACD|nr:sporulation integral membrane protein YtvI [Paenibacillus sp. sptzw28]QYR22016.1 sporulation integral membrane protein YtvI [Paenibacillus sp. sptzw28]